MSVLFLIYKEKVINGILGKWLNIKKTYGAFFNFSKIAMG
jgi:hypothetical protein